MKRIIYIFMLILAVGTLMSVPRELVVVELFTSTLCTGCPGAAMGINDLKTNGHAVAVMTDHYNDPFANATSLARYQYYNIAGTPNALFDGLDPTNSASYETSLYPVYLPKVNSRLAIDSNFTITASATFDSLNYAATVSINKAEPDSNSNVVLHAVVTESALQYVWLNQTTIEDLNRMMIPSHNGTSITVETLDVSQQIDVPLNFTIKNDWNLSNLRIIFWLQNTQTKEILQGKQYTFSELVGSGQTISSPVVSLTQEANTITMNWSVVNNARSYAIWSSPTPEGTYSLLDTTTGTRWSETLLPDHPKRFYKVTALSL